MTKIEYSIDSMSLNVNGHAGAAPAGEDLVCAGISALTQALLNQLRAEEEEKHIQLDWVMFPGQIIIQAHAAAEHKRRIKDYFKVIIKGLEALAENNPAYIQLKEVRDGGNS